MSLTAIPTSVKYLSDGNTAAWPVPFPFGAASQVAAKIVTAEGEERRLAQGRDYLLSNKCVVAVVPAGQFIVIWLDAALETAARMQADHAVSAMGAMGAMGASETADMPALLAQLSAQVAELKIGRAHV